MFKYFIKLFLFLMAGIMCLPLFMILTGSFMGAYEVKDKLGAILEGGAGNAYWTLLPDYPTMGAYVELLLDTPKFFVMFWNSCLQVMPAIIGQLAAAVPAAWAFARFSFRGKNILFFIYTVLMIMPFQVTMVSNYLVLNKFNLMDTHLAIILPNIFSTFPIFILMKFFQSIPNSLIEAAQLDGASKWNIFIRIGVPMGSSGIISIVVLDFLEYWNAIEQPIAFLRNKSLWPLTLYLPSITSEKAGVSFAASVIIMLPALLVFFYGQEYLEQGIMASGIKE